MAASKAASGTGATKKAAKKAATKRVTKTASKKITLKDDTLYVLSVRSKLFFWTPHSVYETREDALAAKAVYEIENFLAMEAAKITRVKLVR